jgi:CRP/FNR family cyclic AMP-dependent transcriptional regulator
MQIFSAKKVIFREGDPGWVAYVIREGSVSIVKRGDQGYVTLATIGPGEIFGEMALIDDGNRSASAIAATDTKCDVIERKSLGTWLSALSPATRSIFEMLLRYIRETLPWEERSKNPLLAAVSDFDLRVEPVMATFGTTPPPEFSSTVLRALYKTITTYVRRRLPPKGA